MKAKGGRKVQGNAVLVHWENLGLAATSATLCSYNQVSMKQTSYSLGLRTHRLPSRADHFPKLCSQDPRVEAPRASCISINPNPIITTFNLTIRLKTNLT